MPRERRHAYTAEVTWTGDLGAGTRAYDAYARRYEARAGAKPGIAGSSDPAFLGDADRWSPEDLLLVALSACHKLWYLHLCSANGVVVRAYCDSASAEMVEEANGAGQFVGAVLRPRVTLEAGSDRALAVALHAKAHAMCFIARSVNFPVRIDPAEPEVAASGPAHPPGSRA